jgi:hypothetical protein
VVLSGIRQYPTFDIRHSTFDIRHSAFGIRHSAFDIRELFVYLFTGGIRHSADMYDYINYSGYRQLWVQLIRLRLMTAHDGS